ncbi:glutamyl-tRNA reductase [Gracilibacillus halophilus YIM-C55.5]|uniref:Glutamyl-tRNA reductase n=1 Tax=Gracilibacillus halophilus YIM-C55.5 TaxID=1308866 RepID=N4WXY5_9BACI|nr:glutamyl-tRNA reductase [Gracilibacillus halophilus]ENH97931.1 glutamyl-tRNA reductase [Gracilibacillus halophilus YIM-C55.5]
MHIVAAGINYRTAPVEVREMLAFSEDSVIDAMQELNQRKSILENVIISTCNRTEVYAVVDQLHTGRYFIKQFLADWFNIDKEAFTAHLIFYENEAAVEHLFRLSCGLDSMIMGETQILGQVKQTFLTAQEEKITGTIFNELFKQAITLGKRSHRETDIGENAVSVSYAAVELSKKIFSELHDKHIVIIGAGKMGELAAKNLYGLGVGEVTVINRTVEKARELAKQFYGKAQSTDHLADTLIQADIVISSTGASDYIVTKDWYDNLHEKRKGKPLFFVDIAVPRDLDPALENLENVFLYDIDDLQHVVDSNMEARKKAAETVELWIEEEIVAFQSWIQTLGVVPVITALREQALSIQQETMNSIERKMPNLTERERKVLNKHTKSIVNQMLKQPILQAKEFAGQKDADEALELFMKIFNIEDRVQENIQSTGKNQVIAFDKGNSSEPLPNASTN